MSTSGEFALQAYIQKTASHLIAAMKAARVDMDVDKSCSQIMVTDVIQLIIHFAKIDSDFSLDEAVLLANIIDWIDPNYRNEHLSSWTSPEQLRWIFVHLDKESLKWTGGKSINLLSRIDDITGSVLAEEARAMYFRIANAIVKVDRQVTTQELEAIAVLKESLYPSEEPATLTSREVDEEPSGQPDVIAIIEIRDLDELMQDLESLVGLETVKKDVQELVIFLRDQRSRKSEGLPTLPIPRHLVFFGNPGTGKTTVASLIAAIYASLGIVSRGHLVKADRSRLVAGNLGHTAPKVRQVTESALGGVLFIDDACSLKGAGQDYGQEAIETLLDLIDDYWEDLIVILAGCPEELTSFVGADQDLRSLFIKYFYFEDYSPIELLNIFCLFCKKVGYRLSSKAYQKLSRGFEILYGTRGEDFENASLARYIFEEVINNQANRIISLSDVSEEQLSAIYAADIPEPV